VGNTFRQQFTHNTAVVKSLLSARDVPLLDLSFDLAAFNFSDTEHLRPDGKYYVASRLAEEIKPGSTRMTREVTTPMPVPTATPVVSSPGQETTAAPANPLLATAQARATIAAGGDLPAEEGVEGTPTPPPAPEEGGSPSSAPP
jgi:hypothetical protein